MAGPNHLLDVFDTIRRSSASTRIAVMRMIREFAFCILNFNGPPEINLGYFWDLWREDTFAPPEWYYQLSEF
jgi:hypothetical protein